MRSDPSTATAVAVAEALGVSKRSAERRALRECWPYTDAPVRGGRQRLYEVSCLPADVRQALAEKALSAAPAAISPPVAAGALFSSEVSMNARLPAPVDSAGAIAAPPGVGELAAWQIEVATARAALIEECERIAAAGQVSLHRAQQILLAGARAGTLAAPLAELVRAANARRGEHRVLSIARLAAWAKEARGAATPAERIRRLAPGSRGKRWTLEPEVAAALALYRRPNKPALRWCVAELVGANSGPAFNSLYARCRRELEKLPAPVFYGGRNTGAALRALQPFRRREFLALEPNDVWIGDGHSAKLRIAHPDSGAPFVPEVTIIMDVPTRYVVGWSVSLSENCIAVADALRHGVSRHGIPLVYYSDNGGGQKNRMFDAPVTGVLSSLGVRHETGIPGNPQGRGVIERFWQTILIPLARRFATYQGRGADRETLRAVSQEVERALRAAARAEPGAQVSALPRRLPTFHEFLEALEAEIERYNETHSHRALPKLDGTTHATPAAYRAHRLGGAAPAVPQPQEVAALFMPSVLRVAARGEVKLWNGIYFHRDLMLVDREEVRVCYDIHDASFVLVRRVSGEFIARAELAGNRSGYLPQPMIERLRDERAARRRALLEKKLEAVDTERGARTLPAPGFSPEERLALEAELEAELAAPAVKPLELMGEMERYAYWKTLHARRAAGEALEESARDFYAGFADTAELYLAEERGFDQALIANAERGDASR